MNESVHVPDELRPIEPHAPEKRHVPPPAPEPAQESRPFSATHERPPLPD